METTLTPRQTFRETVALVAAHAKAKLPTQVNGRIESAVKLVLSHDVTPQEDGSITVGSSSDPLKTYSLVGTACTCQDFERGNAPDGWCQHRIAAAIAKRVLALLPPSPPPAPAVPDAPAPTRERAGMRLEAQVMMDGRQVKVAVWGPDDADVQARLAAVLAQHPVPGLVPQGPDKSWCSKHGVHMPWNEGKEGKRGWYSHRHEGQWCKGK